MATFGKIVTAEELNPPARVVTYDAPIQAEKLPLTAADLEVQSAVAAVDDTYNMWIDAWNGRAPDDVCERLWDDYQLKWSVAQDVLKRNWYISATA